MSPESARAGTHRLALVVQEAAALYVPALKIELISSATQARGTSGNSAVRLTSASEDTASQHTANHARVRRQRSAGQRCGHRQSGAMIMNNEVLPRARQPMRGARNQGRDKSYRDQNQSDRIGRLGRTASWRASGSRRRKADPQHHAKESELHALRQHQADSTARGRYESRSPGCAVAPCRPWAK